MRNNDSVIFWTCLWINLISYACAIRCRSCWCCISTTYSNRTVFVCYARFDWWYCKQRPYVVRAPCISRVAILICIYNEKKKYLMLSFQLCVKFDCRKKERRWRPHSFFSIEPRRRRHDTPKKKMHTRERFLCNAFIHLLKSVLLNRKFKKG